MTHRLRDRNGTPRARSRWRPGRPTMPLTRSPRSTAPQPRACASLDKRVSVADRNEQTPDAESDNDSSEEDKKVVKKSAKQASATTSVSFSSSWRARLMPSSRSLAAARTTRRATMKPHRRRRSSTRHRPSPRLLPPSPNRPRRRSSGPSHSPPLAQSAPPPKCHAIPSCTIISRPPLYHRTMQFLGRGDGDAHMLSEKCTLSSVREAKLPPATSAARLPTALEELLEDVLGETEAAAPLVKEGLLVGLLARVVVWIVAPIKACAEFCATATRTNS
jgi:hypothetical protein